MKIGRCLYQNTIYDCEISGNMVNFLLQSPLLGLMRSGKNALLEQVKLLAPVLPSKIVAVGKNYHDHIIELGGEIPKTPIIFLKPVTAIINPEEQIIYPQISKRVDFEGELAFVIGKTAKNITADCAKEYIFGYTILNDVTARDIQLQDGQWTRAKGFDTFCPIGPIITDEIDPCNIQLTTRLNNEVVQSANTNIQIWNVYEVLEFISQCMTLLPGDVVTTGTPQGIGPMKIGDTIEIEIQNIGVLKNTVI